MSTLLRYALGTAVTGGLVVAAGAYFARRQAAQPAGGPPQTPAPGPQTIPTPKPTSTGPITWDGALPLPTAADIKGDLGRNWGTTPADLRPLFVLAEEASGIVGAARILAVVAYQESRFISTAHNGDAESEQAERNYSYNAYHNNKGPNPALMHGDAAAAFGSGGLFGALAPYFLWSGVQEMKGQAPLLGSDPRIMFLPRVAAFAAMVYMQRLLKNYDIRDTADIKAGWGSISLLIPPGRDGDTYNKIRSKFWADAKTVGIDLGDVATIPTKMRADNWPGVAAVFQKLVGQLPVPKAVV